jgi:uncharacterized membrane protein
VVNHYRASVHTRALDYWLARAAVVGVVALQFLVLNHLSFGPNWLAPSLEVAVLVPLSVTTGLSQRAARQAASDEDWQDVARRRAVIRVLALTLTSIVSIANGIALLELVRALLAGKSQSGATLLLDALNLWGTNVIVFALWYWALDRGGPSMGPPEKGSSPEFVFPQMTLRDQAEQGRSPGFVDYLFLSFTTSTAFSPTDTLPLSQRMKLLMMLEAMISLLTIALVAARAVNILA